MRSNRRDELPVKLGADALPYDVQLIQQREVTQKVVALQQLILVEVKTGTDNLSDAR